MDNPKQNIVKNIAQELDCGFDCYYNSSTDEIIAIPNFSQFSDEEDFKEAFRESLEKIEKHHSDYIKFKVLESLRISALSALYIALFKLSIPAIFISWMAVSSSASTECCLQQHMRTLCVYARYS